MFGPRPSKDERGGGGRDRSERDAPREEERMAVYHQQRRPASRDRRETIRWRCHFRNTVYDVFKS